MILRCQFCGWDNPEIATVCEKCKTPLPKSDDDNLRFAPPQVNDSRVTNRQVGGFDPASTIREVGAQNTGGTHTHTHDCPKCGYPLENDSCPSCGYGASTHSDDEQNRMTVRPNRSKGSRLSKVQFSITPLNEDDTVCGEELFFDNESRICLNRNNVAPSNNTITSKEQAVIEYKEGAWFISDHSELQTTFIRASKPIELHDGDVILMGDQLFCFHTR